MNLPDVLVLSITQDDIDHGVRGDCRTCPAALSGIRTLHEIGHLVIPENVVVDGECLKVYQSLEGIASDIYMDNGILTAWTSAFDNGEPVNPIELTLHLGGVPEIEDN